MAGRIETIAGFVHNVQVAADVGCDHGYIAKTLVEQGRAQKVIACDISAPSLEKAARLAREAGLSSHIETRLGDGLAVLSPGEADAIVIAGMGGVLIRQMLEREPAVAQGAGLLVLAPNRNEAGLRQFLAGAGYSTVQEALALENGRYYQVLGVTPGDGKPEQDSFYYHVGRKLIEGCDPLLPSFLRREIVVLEGILQKAARGKNAGQLLDETAARKKRMEEVLNDVERG